MMTPESFGVGYVVWCDANGNYSNQTDHEPRHRGVTLLSAGVIVKSDKAGITLAQDFSEDGAFRDTKFIPRVNILHMEVLKKEAVRRSPQWAMMPAAQKKRGKKRGKK